MSEAAGPVSGSPFGPVALTPTAFLDRARVVHRDRPALVDGEVRRTYGELADRCELLAGALAGPGVAPGDRVSVLAPNVGIALEAHFGVPWAGAVLNALNTRLSAGELAYVVEHAGSTVLLVDTDLVELGRAVAAQLPAVRLVVAGGPDDELEALLAAATPLHLVVEDELGLLSLNYTSGTTGKPKGVMYSHRGAYLQALAMAAQTGLGARSAYLWTLPMFHCNGWCFPWAVTAAGATHVALRKVDSALIWQAVREQGVTHLCAAPTVLTGLANGPWAEEGPTAQPVSVATGGAPPSPALLARMAELGFDVTHLYGLTETSPLLTINRQRSEEDELPAEERAKRLARAGMPAIGCSVALSETGEVLVRSNVVMEGYWEQPDASADALEDGWFHTGDGGVLDDEGYLSISDRKKDVTGGENVSSIEVEDCLFSHPAVTEVAVIGVPSDKWGETIKALVVVSVPVTEAELIAHCKSKLASYKAPTSIEIRDEIPRTATGKVQKFKLRQQYWEGRDRQVN
mgnify:CR=1 FL=1